MNGRTVVELLAIAMVVVVAIVTVWRVWARAAERLTPRTTPAPSDDRKTLAVDLSDRDDDPAA